MNKEQHEQGMDDVAIKRGYLPTIVDYYLQDSSTISRHVIEYMENRVKGTLEEFLQLNAGEKVLDIGSGAGTFTVYLAKKYNVEIWAQDVSTSWLEIVERRAKDNKVNIHLVHNTAEVLPFADNSFDKIVCSEVLEHIMNKNKAIREMYRVLKPQGVLALSTPNKWNTKIYMDFPYAFVNTVRRSISLIKRNNSATNLQKRPFDEPVNPIELKKLVTNTNFQILSFEHLIFGPDTAVYWGYLPIKLQVVLLPFARFAEKVPLSNILNAKLLLKARK